MTSVRGATHHFQVMLYLQGNRNCHFQSKQHRLGCHARCTRMLCRLLRQVRDMDKAALHRLLPAQAVQQTVHHMVADIGPAVCDTEAGMPASRIAFTTALIGKVLK
ncbi:Uncharacterised protein [Serratia fonticola]|uniref:Uncharacterized protein n=1 Tax=Serratia fonticola TaxID=47917 RepID=A0A4U9ULK3_SERFO|nr:Uncharacterised protein [Serratia fonticola]